MKKIKVTKEEAYYIADLKNYERLEEFYRREIENSKNMKESSRLVEDYHATLVSTVDKSIVSPFLKSNTEKKERFSADSLHSALSATAFTLSTCVSLAGYLGTDSKGFLILTAGSFALAVAKTIKGVYSLIKSSKEKKKRLDIIDTWEFAKNESPIDVLDFCEENNLELLTNPFYFELSYIRDNREDKTELIDPFRKNRFKKEAKKYLREGVDEEDYQHYKEVIEQSSQETDDENNQ